MKQNLLCVLLACTWAWMVAHAADSVATNASTVGRTLTLDDAKATVLRDHPSLDAMRERVTAAAAAVHIARSAYWPQLDAAAGATRIEDHSYVGMPPAFVKMIDVTPYTTYSIDLTAGWLLFDGFARDFRLRATEHGADATRAAYADTQRLMLQAVSAVYCQALLAREGVRIAREDADFTGLLLADARNRAAAGAAPRSEVLTFENRRDMAESQRIEAAKGWVTARAALAELLAVPGGQLPETLDLVAPPATNDVPDADACLREAVQQRPDMRAAEAQYLAAEAQRHAADAAWWPRVSAVGQVGYARDDSLRLDMDTDQNLMVGVQATWNLFSGGRDSAKRAAASAAARAAADQRDALALKVATEVRQQLAAIEASRQQLELQARIRERAVQIRDLVRQEYLGGTANVTRMNETQSDTVKADAALAIARIGNVLHRENLAAATGRAWGEVNSEQ